MFRTAVSVLCAIAVLAPTAAFAGDRHNRGAYDRSNYERKSYGRSYDNRRDVERIRTIDFYRNRDFDRRDRRDWERREAERSRYWRDRRDDRYRRDYDRDRYNRPSVIIFPRISF
ncbi:MAG: hypothetical protein KME45_24365 [Stenomitos rutilans HA7619-LM2]|jgi:hypothetical protein|nr:hypothetical protein [Stenomitos rutilans HA7619-LM2]